MLAHVPVTPIGHRATRQKLELPGLKPTVGIGHLNPSMVLWMT